MSEQMIEPTKANRDCLAKAKAGEPMFIILGRDPDGGNIVRLWAQRRFDAGDTEHAEAVFAIVDAMDAWRAAGNLPGSAPDADKYPPIAAHSVMAGKVAELTEALTGLLAVPKIAGCRPCGGGDLSYGPFENVFAKADAALAPYPERRSE